MEEMNKLSQEDMEKVAGGRYEYLSPEAKERVLQLEKEYYEEHKITYAQLVQEVDSIIEAYYDSLGDD